jgi:hypothetical protein
LPVSRSARGKRLCTRATAVDQIYAADASIESPLVS